MAVAPATQPLVEGMKKSQLIKKDERVETIAAAIALQKTPMIYEGPVSRRPPHGHGGHGSKTNVNIHKNFRNYVLEIRFFMNCVDCCEHSLETRL